MYSFTTRVFKLTPVLLMAFACTCLAGTRDAEPPFQTVALAPGSTALDATDLKFREFFKMPVGPRGLEPTEKLLRLNGKCVLLLGYMVRQEQAAIDTLLLTPLPVTMGDEDEGLADDLPPTTVFVHLANADLRIPYVTGLVKVSGILSIGGQDEEGGRVSTVRLLLDATASEEFLRGLQEDPARK